MSSYITEINTQHELNYELPDFPCRFMCNYVYRLFVNNFGRLTVLYRILMQIFLFCSPVESEKMPTDGVFLPHSHLDTII